MFLISSSSVWIVRAAVTASEHLNIACQLWRERHDRLSAEVYLPSMPVFKVKMVTDRSCEAEELGYAGEQLVNYLMTCEKDSLGKSELADATQYQTTCQEESKLPSVGTRPPWESKK